ncbi:prostaglandin G/H synthase 1 isoform X1 [Crotalus tigris]|uniref:prostaglandin G/H synthase 1 isoform X1 n=1 Tax=Crotalus tigris TaxID=88082 RepID=UPI00192F3271|nr:prostaglandin G/H synthase 1 isoform X1 [Crotalus tigris]
MSPSHARSPKSHASTHSRSSSPLNREGIHQPTGRSYQGEVDQESDTVDPCCYFPCQHSGLCVRIGTEDYECDCTRTGYYGTNCSSAEFWTWLYDTLKPSPSSVHHLLTHFRWLWSLVNRTFLQGLLMRLVLTARANLIPSPPTFSGNYGYLNWESYSNLSYFTRILPPVPPNCPTPMGVKGPLELPGAELVAEELLLRRTFHPDPQRTNLMFAFFAQHFTHQFFKTFGKMGRGFTRALGHGVDLGHIYGDNLERQHHLRLFKDGKLKYQVMKGEMYPPTVMEAAVHMIYPQGTPPEQRFAIGQEVFGLLPGLLMYATLWLREHNRVCDLLKQEHPTWDDEQLFQTARLILTGETIKIVIEDYVQHLSGYHFKLTFAPELLFGAQFQYQNRIALEFNQLYHWHALMPNSFQLPDREYSYDQFLFNSTLFTHYSIETLVEAFSKQRAGQIGGKPNINKHLLKVAIGVIKESRLMRLQPFNEYRKRFHLKPYTSFRELTDDENMVAKLEALYGDIDALEFFPGLLVEKTYSNGIFGQSMIEMGAPFSLKGLLGNPICSPEYWKPSTFGGAAGFRIVNTASLEKLVCLNVKRCPYVAFHTPDHGEAPEGSEEKQRPSTEL